MHEKTRYYSLALGKFIIAVAGIAGLVGWNDNRVTANQLEQKVIAGHFRRNAQKKMEKAKNPNNYLSEIQEDVNKKMLKASKRAYCFLIESGLDIPKCFDATYARSTIGVESTDNPNDHSPAGAKGYPQTYPSVWKEEFPRATYEDFEKGIRDPYKSSEFVLRRITRLYTIAEERFGKRFTSLSEQEQRSFVEVMYNLGQNHELVKTLDLDPERFPEETRNHIKKMRAAYQKFSSEFLATTSHLEKYSAN